MDRERCTTSAIEDAAWTYDQCASLGEDSSVGGSICDGQIGSSCDNVLSHHGRVRVKIPSRIAEPKERRNRSWVITVNNYDEECISKMRSLVEHCTYLIFGKEKGSQGTNHLQGYFTLRYAKTFRNVQKVVPHGSHLEVAKGSAIQNREYCSKEGDFEEYGDIPRPGKRTDLEECADTVMKDGLVRACIEHPGTMIRYGKGMLLYKGMMEERLGGMREKQRNTVWISGKPGSGKTRSVFAACSNIRLYIDSGSSEFFSPHDGQKVALFDDLRPRNKSISSLFKVFDPFYNAVVNCKGSQTVITSDVIFVTSVLKPREFMMSYPHEPAEQLVRRVNMIETDELTFDEILPLVRNYLLIHNIE